MFNYRLVRRSLGDEMKRLGVLGSPFCDKAKCVSPGNENLSYVNCRDALNDFNLPTNASTEGEGSLHNSKVQEQCSKTQFNDRKRNVNWTKETVNAIWATVLCSAQAMSFLSFGRSLTNHRLQLYFQKVFIVTVLLALQFLMVLF